MTWAAGIVQELQETLAFFTQLASLTNIKRAVKCQWYATFAPIKQKIVILLTNTKAENIRMNTDLNAKVATEPSKTRVLSPNTHKTVAIKRANTSVKN